MKFNLSEKYLEKKIKRAWFPVVIIPVIWVGFPVYEFVIKQKTPSLEFQLIMAVILTPFVFMLVKPAKKESGYWKKYGKKIGIELLSDKMVFIGADGKTELPYTSVKDIKLDIKWRHLKAVHIETKSGESYIVQGYDKLEQMVHLFREKFPELAKKK